MMSDRCAICDADNELRTLCDMHRWLSHVYTLVYTGGWSEWDWPPDMIGPLVSQQHMMRTEAAHPVYWQATVLATLASMDVVWDDGQPWQESYGDWLAVNGYLGNNNNNGNSNNGKAA